MKIFSFLLALLTISIAAHADEKVTENIKVVNASSNSVNNAPFQSMMDGARQLLAEENYRAAAVELKQLAKSNESNPEVWSLLGMAAHRKGDFLGSKIAFEKALKLDPDNKTTLGFQADLFLSIGDKQSAHSNLEKLKVLCPSGCDSRERIASALGLF